MNFYELIDLLKQLIEENSFTNKITFGDISDIDLNKDTTFPLLHIMLEEAVIEEKTIDYRLNVIAADVVDIIDENLGVDDFYGNDNTQDILNTQLRVVTIVPAKASSGTYTVLVTVEGQPPEGVDTTDI